VYLRHNRINAFRLLVFGFYAFAVEESLWARNSTRRVIRSDSRMPCEHQVSCSCSRSQSNREHGNHFSFRAAVASRSLPL
jgi:hypothetical protein